ncbi:hypothetical protein, partial [Streptomyces sp. NPDC052127]|uniref:hypothetical protein n=1 Tax=Streptomyces sp. NPDC052127 TaxID=3155679 RepID=UPI0034305F17
ADMVSMAFRECYHGAPGPAFLEIPRDVLDAKQPVGQRPLPRPAGLPLLGRLRATPFPAGGFQPLDVIFRRPVSGSVLRTDVSHLRVRPVGEAAPLTRTRFSREAERKKFLSESLTLSQPPRTLCQQALS